MFCKNCHSSGEQGGVYTARNLMASKRVAYPVHQNFVCNTCGATQDVLSQGKEAEVFFQSQTARKLLCHPLPMIYRSQEAERTMMLEEKGSRLTRPKVSTPLAVRTFDIEIGSFRQTRNWFKKQTSSDTVFKASSRAQSNKSTSSFGKADSSQLGGSMLVDCQSQLSSRHDMDEDMTRILNQLKANFRLEGGGVGMQS